MTTRKMAVEASCRKYLDAIARRLSDFYIFHQKYDTGPTMGDVLASVGKRDWTFKLAPRDGVQIQKGKEVTIRKGDRLTKKPLFKLFQKHEWKLIRKLNQLTSDRIHDASLPRLSDNRAFIIIPHDEFKEDTIAHLKNIGVKSLLLADHDALVVKDEQAVSESSFIL